MTGCRNNRYELDRICSWAIQNKVAVVAEEEADFCIINTCTVTHAADRKSRQMVRRTKNNNQPLKTIVFGCAARMRKEVFEQIGEVDVLLPDMEAVIAFLEQELVNECDAPSHKSSKSHKLRSRALTQIQDGCDNFCTFCITVQSRGHSKNRPVNEIVEEIQAHERNGYNEVVLTGINIGAYGAIKTTDYENSALAQLLEMILEKTTITRIRLSSMGPQYFNERLYEILKNPRICRYIHLSIQSGSTSVLERMRRQYTADDVEIVIKRFKKEIPGIAITADVIVGFPGETEEEFAETMHFMECNPLAKMHVFPYSAREGTVAATMKQVSDDEKKKRAKKLQALADKQQCDFIQSQIGKTASTLWRKKIRPEFYEGLTDNYIRVCKKGDATLIRSISEEVLDETMLIF